tara:strand:+ start:42 stop:1028 length:987 start_codon:yes stop_codon:yes gene_type:complete
MAGSKSNKILNELHKFKNRFSKSMTKVSRWYRVLIGVFLLFILFQLRVKLLKGEADKEEFTQKKQYVMKEGPDAYDDFYAEIYDDLYFDHFKNGYEVSEIDRNAKVEKNSRVLNVGCGNGHYVDNYRKLGTKDVIGLDKSQAMINRAKSKFPKSKFVHGDALNSSLFIHNRFTHILLFNFTIYHIQNKDAFFKNCYDWLMPGGYLVLHMVNRDKFDPIIPSADPLHGVYAQNFAKNRVTNSVIKFKDFLYKANFELDKKNNMAYLKETMKDDDSKHVRENNHIYYMETQKSILAKAKSKGFILNGTIDMRGARYPFQYLYVLYKPAAN